MNCFCCVTGGFFCALDCVDLVCFKRLQERGRQVQGLAMVECSLLHAPYGVQGNFLLEWLNVTSSEPETALILHCCLCGICYVLVCLLKRHF